MTTTLQSGRTFWQPSCMAVTPFNDVLIVDGLNTPQRWDGLTATTEIAGIPGNTNAVAVASGSGTLNGVYTYGIQFIDDDGVGGNVSEPLATVTCTNDSTLTWTVPVPNPVNARITHTRLWRSTADQSSVLYLVDTIPFDDITYVDTTTDAILGAGTVLGGTALVVATADGSLPAPGYARVQPPNWKSVMVQHQSRMYAAVDVEFDKGHVQLTNNSDTLVPVGMLFNTSLTGRRFYITGDPTEYTVASVALNGTSLSLDVVYSGTTDNFAEYAVRSERGERSLVYYTYIGLEVEPESWPLTYSFSVPEQGGNITGLMPLGSMLYILKESAIYRFTVQEDPAIDGAIFQAIDGRGCENHRCWVKASGSAYLMDRQGIYAFNGSSEQRVGEPIRDLFDKGQINWKASKWFHAAFDQEREVVMFFVALGGSYLPRHALCYHIRDGRWWMEEYPHQVGGSCNALVHQRKRLLIGAEHARVLTTNEGNLDGIAPNIAGTLRGTASSSTLFSISDSTASFPSSAVDFQVAIVDGTGKGQVRRIVAVTSTKLSIKDPWTIKPDTTSIYQIGGFQYYWRGPRMRLTERAADTSRECELTYEPTDSEAYLFYRQYMNHEKTSDSGWWVNGDSGIVYSKDGVSVRDGDPNIRLNLHHTQSDYGNDEGYKRWRQDGNSAVLGSSDHWLSPELWGHAGEDRIQVYELSIDGVR